MSLFELMQVNKQDTQNISVKTVTTEGLQGLTCVGLSFV